MSNLWQPPPPATAFADAEALFRMGWPWAWPGVPAAALRGTTSYALWRMNIAWDRFVATVIERFQ